MKPLPEILTKNGFTYTQTLTKGRKYIYEQRVTAKMKYYEVFRAKIKPSQILNGNEYPERQVFPSNESFGKTAWTYRTLELAKEKFDKLKV